MGKPETPNQDAIAIVGMAGRFPGAADVQGFWANLVAGVESIRTFSDAELDAAGADRSVAGFVPRGSVMDGVELFDAAFFGMSPREAELTDPQHRVFLECAWTAFEHAGYDPTTFDGRIGVFGGVSPNTYFRNNVSGHRDLLARIGDFSQVIASEREHAVTRVAYKLGLRGPAVSVSTASSTSAVATHLAIGSLLLGECDIALAGGCRIRVPTTAGYVYEDDGIVSPDGHCRPFDADARGTVLASGVAMVVLKRLQDAIDDGDTIYALIRGSAINNDGRDKIGYTAPSIEGQSAVIAEALDVAQVDVETISMVEAHGTGTSLGDPIEVMALTRAHRRQTDRRQYAAIGSLKSNVGHIDAAAGTAGIIKAALSLHHEQIPPSINFTAPNPQIDFESSPFFVNTELRQWPRAEAPRRATVSSFGLGGTNAHLVLEEAPLAAASPSPSRSALLLPLSARSEEALERRRRELADHLASRPDVDLADVAFTLGAGRARMPHRQAFVAAGSAEAVDALRATGAGSPVRVSASESVGVAFLFPGQGAQHLGMGAALYGREPAFTKAFDACADGLKPILGVDLRALLFGKPDDASVASEALAHAGIAQPATFAMSYALAQLWMSWGIQPSMLVGHSMGEFAAACVSGVFDLGDALSLIAERGRLSQGLDGGRMVTVLAGPEMVEPMLGADTSIAAINAPTVCVVSGPAASVAALEERLRAADIATRPLTIEHAAHSPMVEPIIGAFRERVAATSRHPQRVPLISTVTGDWATDEQLMSADYWADHLRATVRYSDAVGRVLDRADVALLEVGAGQTLATLARRHPSATKERAIVASLGPPGKPGSDEQADLMRALGQLWTAGVDVDWTTVHGGPRRRVELPTYPFDHQRYWIDPVSTTPSTPPARELLQTPNEVVEIQPPAPAPPPATVPATAPATVAATATAAPPSGAESRATRIAAQLAEILSDLSGIDPSSLDPTASFSDLGFDSLFLTQANSQFRKRFGVPVTFRQLFEEAPSITALAAFIDGRLAPEVMAAPATPPEPAGAAPQETVAGSPEAGAVERLIAEQLRMMEKQLELLRWSTTQTPPPAPAPVPSRTSVPAAAPVQPAAQAVPADDPAPKRRHYLATSDQQGDSQALTERQATALADLIRRYNARTAGSKRRAQEWRARLADNRTIVGFDVRWKELVYQIVSERSKGSRIFDIDGNELIDLALGFGTNLLGHSPDVVVDAVRDQLERGFEVGVQSRLLGEVTELICAATSNERLTYTTSGAEAVVSAVRIARTVTGRDRVAFFRDSIHGRNDMVLARAVGAPGQVRSVPLVAGVPQSAVSDSLVLEYGTDQALEAIASVADELALVLVEPVQTRHPDLQPIEFLRQLRRMADEHGFLLVFDEVVTGFRAHLGGVQALFDIKADITTYGKVVGGGLPIGVVAGRSRFIDVVDGGPWAFGDDSRPEADITASGGTLIKHPLTLAATRAVLSHLVAAGPSLQVELSERTADAVRQINDAFRSDGLPVHVEQFSSFFRPNFTAAPRFAGLFEYYLRDQGVHSNPPSPAFLSTAHTAADVEAVVAAYATAGRAMADDGFLEATAAPAAGGSPAALADSTSSVTATAANLPVPVLPNVHRFLVERGTPNPDQWNLATMVQPTERLDPEVTRKVVALLLERHDAMRLRFRQGPGGWESSLAGVDAPVPFEHVVLSGLGEAEQNAAIERRSTELQQGLSLERGPLVRVALFDLGERGQRLLVVVHHFASDGISWAPFWEDFEAVHRSLEQGTAVPPPPSATPFSTWAKALQRRADSNELQEDGQRWLDLGWEAVRPIPLDHTNGNGGNTNASAREVILEFSEEETRAVFHGTPGVRQKVDLLVTALAEVASDWTGSKTVLIDLMGHGRDESAVDDVDLLGSVGFFISYTPMVLTVARNGSNHPGPLTDQIQPLLRHGLDFDLLRYMASDAAARQPFRELPRAQILFNHMGRRDDLDTTPVGTAFTVAPESLGDTHSPNGLRYYPLAVSSQVWRDRLRLVFVYSENLHSRATVEGLAKQFKERLLSLVAHARRA